MKFKKIFAAIIFLSTALLVNCSSDKTMKPATLDDVIHIGVYSDPDGANVYFRIVSGTPEVQSTNRIFLGTTPYSGTRRMRIPGLTEEDANKVDIVIELNKKGYYEQMTRHNLKAVLNARTISVKSQLVKKSNRD